jgi:N-acetylglucosamine kinase-like BadF-type ATPase
MSLFIGVDGGGTKTAVSLISANTDSLEPISTVSVGATNWNSVGIEKSKENLFEGIRSVLTAASKSISDGTNSILGLFAGLVVLRPLRDEA